MTLLETRGLHVRIGGRAVCDALDLRVEAGHNWAVLGANGAGKTTLLHSLAGLRSPATGRVLLGTLDICHLPARERARRLGILFQDPEGGIPMTVLESVLAGRHPHLGRWQWEQETDHAMARAALAAVGLDCFGARDISTLSGGERRRADIATVLAQDAPLSLWDEPTNHLDLRHQTRILDLLAARSRGGSRANIFVLHDVNLALRYCSHALLLFADGRVVQDEIGMFTDPGLFEDLYGCPIGVVAGDGVRLYYPR